MPISHQRFEELLNEQKCILGMPKLSGAWPSFNSGYEAGKRDAKKETALRLARLYCIACANGMEYDASADYHPANNRSGVLVCKAWRIRREFPEAFKAEIQL